MKTDPSGANPWLMTCEIIELPRSSTPTSLPSCSPNGCAGLCTEDGLAAAYGTYYSRLKARARLVVVDPHLADEVVQDVFVRAWRRCSTFDPDAGPLVNWLLVITRNAAIDLVKARVRRPPLAPQLPDAVAEQALPGISETDRILLRHELGQLLDQIGDDHRTVIVETILRDRTYAEVAEELGVPAGTLRSRAHYALRRMRTLLDDPEAA